MAIEIFNRYEHKYLLTTAELERMLDVIDEHMLMDKYCKNRSTYTIANLYYDTSDDHLIRHSLEKPEYKEKLRLRSYGVPDADSKVFLEIKKKCYKCVNKRRTALKLEEAYRFCETGIAPDYKEYMNRQVCMELQYFLKFYELKPKVYIAYDRLAFFEKNDPDLRISFDTHIRTRRFDLRLENGDHGELLLPEDMWLMEVKTSRAKPLWLCAVLSELQLKRVSFSKYGTEFKRTISA